MRRELVGILACPHCRGDLRLTEVREANAIRVLSGALVCVACGRRYRVEKAVARLAEADRDVVEIGKRFEFQWVSRWSGQFESKDRCYGFDHRDYATWMRDQLARHVPLGPGDWVLDAGCGSGEKTNVLARECPEQRIVGMDLALGSLERAAAAYGDMPNLDYVEGNVLRPPIKDRTFRWGISIGVLHHTPSTRRALACFRKLLTTDAAMLIWIYPSLTEAPEWQLMYMIRDLLLMGQGPELPPAFLRALSFLIVLSCMPLAHLAWEDNAQRMRKDLPFFKHDGMSWREQFLAMSFHLFDTLHPRYQFRHKRSEIERWLTEEGLEPRFAAHGYYVASAAT